MSLKDDARMTSRWIDVSVPLKNGMVHWPGDPAFNISQPRSLDRGDTVTLSHLDMGVHSGTHMDAPAHFVSGGKHIEDLPLDAVIGRARVIAIRSKRRIEPAELKTHGIRRGERLLFKTANSRRCWATNEFVEDFVYISPAAAEWLAERGVKTVGVDYLSVGGYKAGGRETHLALLGAGIWVIEGLNLSAAKPGPVDLVCLPIRLIGAEGAPARVIVRRR